MSGKQDEDDDTSDPEGENVLSDFRAKLAKNDSTQLNSDGYEKNRKSKQCLKRLRPNISDGWLVSIKDRLMRQYGVDLYTSKAPEGQAAAAVQQSSAKEEGSKKQVARNPRGKAQGKRQ